MEIEKVIEIFEKCIPYYQKAVDEKWSYNKLKEKSMQFGLCNFVAYKLNTNIVNAFKEHYKFYIIDDYLVKSPWRFQLYGKKNLIKFTILPRLNFLKTEVKRLKRLQKQGYTHI